jgi:transposase
VPQRERALPHFCTLAASLFRRVRFLSLCRSEVLRRILMDVANELRERGALDEEECFIDATFVMAEGGARRSAKRGKGMKIVAIVDRHGGVSSPKLPCLILLFRRLLFPS